MDLTLYINSAATDKRQALVAGLADPTSIALPALTYGDTLNLTVYLVTSAGAYHADSGSASAVPTLKLGQRDQASLVTSPTFTSGQGNSSKAWTATLALGTDATLGDALAMFLAAGPQRPIPTLTISTTKSSVPTTWLAQPVEILGSIV